MEVMPVLVTLALLAFSGTNPAFTNKHAFTVADLYNEHDLGRLCPGVDICSQNGTQSRIQAAEVTGLNEGYCCKRCSCHEDCHDNMDCCFSNDNNITGTVPGKRYSTKECLYVQTGSPQDKWPIDVPAFRIVTSPPEGGCKANVTCPAFAGRNSTASCDRMGLWSWGDLFPVYSNENGEIYINGLCACCHGAEKYEPWQPNLICETKNSSNKKYLMNDHLRVLEKDFNTSHCYILFRYSTPKDLHDKRCYVNTTSSCNSAFKFQVPSRSNMTSDEIVEACKFGPNAPVPGEMKVYKNVYCAVCNEFKMQHLADCTRLAVNDPTRFLQPVYSIVLVLDTEFYQNEMMGMDYKKPDQPQVCSAKEETPLSRKKCRDVLCPSGQTRHHQGECMFTAMIWSKVLFTINIKLECISTGKDIKQMILDKDISYNKLDNTITKSSPWPNYWMTIGITLDVSEVHDNRFIIVQLGCNIGRPALLYRDVRKSIDLPWKFTLNNATYIAQQGFLEYAKVYFREKTTYAVWTRYKEDIEKETNLSTNHAFFALMEIRVTTYTLHLEYLNKLFFCDQVLLAPNEFVLLASETVLVSNLTTNTLFDAEFELFPDENGLISARVCLSDSVFKIHFGANISSKLKYTDFLAMFVVGAISALRLLFIN